MRKSNTKTTGYVTLPGSSKAAPAPNRIDTINPNEVFEITVKIARRGSLDAALKSGRRLNRDSYRQRFGASEDQLDLVEDFASEFGLTVSEVDIPESKMCLKGRTRDLEEAFQVHLSNYSDPAGKVYRGRSGDIRIPSHLVNVIDGVYGLDNRPHATPKFQTVMKDGAFIPHSAASAAFYPNQVAELYRFPSRATGKGQCIGLVELGGGYRPGDLNSYFSSLGIKTPHVKAVSVDGAVNSPTTPDGADGEVMLDIEVAGLVAPDADIVVYFAPNTDRGFLDAISKAIHDTRNAPDVISISWGSPELVWTAQALKSFNDEFKTAAVLGVTVCVAAGDRGSSDGVGDGKVHVDFPASSPFVLGCGGTRLEAKNGRIAGEVVWHESNSSATGGGVSNVFPLPQYQGSVGVPLAIDTGFKGRGVPDVAADADPVTGYKVLVDGQEMVIGGTSAVAPLMAALTARVNQLSGKTAGFLNNALYSKPSSCRDITQGNNITTSTDEGYSARKGWDACTGLGVPSDFPPSGEKKSGKS